MNFAELLTKLDTYSILSLTLAVPVCLLTSILKRHCRKSLKKLYTFAPFLLGILLTGTARAVQARSFSLDWAGIVTEGVRCGGVSTILYVVYEQFLRRRALPSSSPAVLSVIALLEPYVSEENRAAVAGELVKAAGEDPDENIAAAKVVRLLSQTAASPIDEQELRAFAQLVVQLVRKL